MGGGGGGGCLRQGYSHTSIKNKQTIPTISYLIDISAVN